MNHTQQKQNDIQSGYDMYVKISNHNMYACSPDLSDIRINLQEQHKNHQEAMEQLIAITATYHLPREITKQEWLESLNIEHESDYDSLKDPLIMIPLYTFAVWDVMIVLLIMLNMWA